MAKKNITVSGSRVQIDMFEKACLDVVQDYKIPYKTSTDYSCLWKLIKKGKVILGWIHNKRVNRYDCVEIKIKPDGYYMIGVRGIGFESGSQRKMDFISDCEFWKLKYIEPNKL